ncbi:MAG: integrase core domain-containing protein [Nitrospirota bacterium]
MTEGHIERAWTALKQLLRMFDIKNEAELQATLELLRDTYNQHRPHQALSGHTPVEAWHILEKYKTKTTEATITVARRKKTKRKRPDRHCPRILTSPPRNMIRIGEIFANPTLKIQIKPCDRSYQPQLDQISLTASLRNEVRGQRTAHPVSGGHRDPGAQP